MFSLAPNYCLEFACTSKQDNLTILEDRVPVSGQYCGAASRRHMGNNMSNKGREQGLFGAQITTFLEVPLLATIWNYLFGGTTPCYHLELPLWWYHPLLPSGTTSLEVPPLATTWNYLFGGTTPGYHLELPLWRYHSWLPTGTTSLVVPLLATNWNYLFGGTTPGYHLELPLWW